MVKVKWQTGVGEEPCFSRDGQEASTEEAFSWHLKDEENSTMERSRPDPKTVLRNADDQQRSVVPK